MPRPVEIQINETGNAVEALAGVSAGLIGIGAAAVGAASIAVIALGKIGISAVEEGLKFDATLEQLQISFDTLAKSQLPVGSNLADINKLGKEMLDWVKDIAIRTPFETMDLAGNLRILLAMGVPFENAKKMLIDIGDAVSAIGGNKETLANITDAFAKIEGKGKVATRELMSLAENGIPAFQILQEKLGVSRDELDKMLQKGLIPANVGIEALSKGIEERFGGAMEKQSLSMNGLLSSLEDFKSFLLADITAPLFEDLKPVVTDLLNLAQSPEFKDLATKIGVKLGETFEAALPVLKEMAETLLPKLIKAMPYLIEAWDGFIKLLKSPEFHVAMREITSWIGNGIIIFSAIADVLFNKAAPAFFQFFNILIYGFRQFLSWAEGLPNQMRQLGNNIVQGLKDGLYNAWQGLLNLAYQIAQSVKNTIQDALNIHSPSKDMEYLGQMTARGFYVGMEKEFKAQNSVANNFAPVININNPTVRSDADIPAIARQVQFEMNKQALTYRGGFATQTV